MTRLLGLLAFGVLLVSAQPVFAKNDHNNGNHNGQQGGSTRAVPELSAGAAGTGLAIIAGAAAIVFARRRKRRS